MAKKEIKKTTNKSATKQKSKKESVVNEVIESVVEETVNKETIKEPVDGITSDELNELFGPFEADHEEDIDIVDSNEVEFEDVDERIQGIEGSELVDLDERPNTDCSSILVSDDLNLPEGAYFKDIDINDLKKDELEKEVMIPQNLSSLHSISDPKTERNVYRPVKLSSLM